VSAYTVASPGESEEKEAMDVVNDAGIQLAPFSPIHLNPLFGLLVPVTAPTDSTEDADAYMSPHSVASVLPEVETYLFTLIITSLLREKLNNEAAYGATVLIDRIKT